MIEAIGVTYRVGKKALFEDVNIKFTEGNCYGLIGANGAGKSTFLKILAGQLETTNGTIAVTPGDRISFLEQDHFKYDDYEVLDAVILGNPRLYEVMKEKDAIYAKEDFTDEEKKLVGFARVISDHATTWYLCDVVIDPEYRHQGLGKKLVSHIASLPEYTGLLGMLLTKDAHGLYEKYGFGRVDGRAMTRVPAPQRND